MGMTKAKGNMYDWVTHTHSHLGGECTNRCSYCYVQAMEERFHSGKYAGELRFIEKELEVNYGNDNKIFVEHCNDLCGDGVKDEWIEKIISHCLQYPNNKYVFQTRNPQRLFNMLVVMPQSYIVGTTLETDDKALLQTLSAAPSPSVRIEGLRRWRLFCDTYITIEPILKFDVDRMMDLIKIAEPGWVNIGADSKGGNLPEPSKDDVLTLIDALHSEGIKIRKKSNLSRILGE